MHKILIIAATALSLAACTATQQGAAVGAGVGGVAGAVASGGNVVGTAVGAGIGAVAGAAAGDLLSRGYQGNPNRCVYRNPRTGEQYVDTCPQG